MMKVLASVGCLPFLLPALCLPVERAPRALAGQDVVLRFAGVIEKVDGKKVTLSGVGTNKDEITIAADDKTEVTLDGKKAKLADLKPGQIAQVTQEGGKTTKIEAKKKRSGAKAGMFEVEKTAVVK